MKKPILIVVAILMLSKAFGQKVETIFLDKKDKTKNCYTIIYPAKLPYRGFLCLIPGFGETADQISQQTALHQLAAQSGILTIIPTFNDGVLSFGIDTASQQSLVNILDHASNKLQLSALRFFIGGFSIGGSAAIKYAETAVAKNLKIKPSLIFAIDPPLDFERFYYSAKRDVRLSVSSVPSQENVYMIKRIEEVMGGTPASAIENYYSISPYSFNDQSQQAIKKLVNTPLRIYSEPDVNWWINERRSDLSAMNVLDCSAMINELNRLGNAKAQLITTTNKGFRKPENRRHPHSWSIVNNDELISWLLAE